MLNLLVLHLNKSTEHSYILTAQWNCLKGLKEPLPENEIIGLGDMVKNHTCLAQDKNEGVHWNHQQCSLHPAVICYRKSSHTKSHTLRFVSDDVTQDIDFVYMVIKETFVFINNFILSTLFFWWLFRTIQDFQKLF